MTSAAAVLAAGLRARPVRHVHHYYSSCYGTGCPAGHLNWWAWLAIITLIVALAAASAVLKRR